jgi:hypothetical protein
MNVYSDFTIPAFGRHVIILELPGVTEAQHDNLSQDSRCPGV